MKLFLFLILFTLPAWSADKLVLVFPSGEIRQGSLVKARMLVSPESVNLPVQKLKGETVGETVYFQQLSPLLKKEDASTYESEVSVIFIKVPETNSLTGKLGQQDFLLEWNAIQITPVESPGQMIWADFSAPDFMEGNWRWLWITLIAIPLLWGGMFLWRKWNFKTREKERKRKLLEEIKNCRNYEEVVTFWKKKRFYLRDFPHLENSFPAFEQILFKYQFKPSQTENEKNEVMVAYRKLLQDSEGGFRGI